MKNAWMPGWLALAAALLLSACADSDPARGDLRTAAAVNTTFTKSTLDAATAESGLQALTEKAACDVKVVPLDHYTLGVRGERTNATGVLLLPSNCAAANAPLPLLAYTRGTEVYKQRTLANPNDSETQLLSAFFAAQGYAVVATDYLGFGGSAYSFHPYLHADSEANTNIDAIRAARRAATNLGVALPGKLMLSGYSQGGHASAATQRLIERDFASEFNLVAAAHLAGPYNMAGSLLVPDAVAGVQFFVPFTVTAWQKVYGDMYAQVTDAFKAPYASYIESLLPNPTLTYTTLITSGKLPGGLGETPNQARDAMFQSAYLAAIQSTSSAPYKNALKNTLLDWKPKAPTLLCGGSGDPTVPPAVHMTVAYNAFTAAPAAPVQKVDVDSSIQAVYGGVLSSDPATYYGKYHGTYEPPFCIAAARSLFNPLK